MFQISKLDFLARRCQYRNSKLYSAKLSAIKEKIVARFLKNITALCTILLFISCTTTATFYPIQGPLSEQKPIPVLVANVDGIMGNTGNINLTMPDGEICKGKWSSAAGMQVSVGTVNLFSQYGSALGTGYSVTNAAGVNRGEAILIGERGTQIEVEFYTGSGTASGYGLAKDNHGNIYKLLF